MEKADFDNYVQDLINEDERKYKIWKTYLYIDPVTNTTKKRWHKEEYKQEQEQLENQQNSSENNELDQIIDVDQMCDSAINMFLEGNRN